MSYGLYADTTATFKQLRELVETRDDVVRDDDSEVLCLGNTTETGSVEMGFSSEDDELINTMNIRGDFEPTMRELILAIDPDATIVDEDEMFADDDDGLFENDAVLIVDLDP